MNGKVLIITGSTGIAAASARLAASRGARVVIATADEDSGWDLGRELGLEPWVGNLTRPGAGRSVVEHAMAQHRRIDGVFNASGLSGRRHGDGPVHQISDDGWEMALAHNVSAAFSMCRAVIERLLLQEADDRGVRGSIVNLGSVLADSPEPSHFAAHAYAAAKGAVAAMTRSMASYYAPHGIRVNLLAPGFVRTRASERGVTPELLAFLEKKQPLTGGMVDAEDVARAALFLLSDEARSITGEAIAVDGGWSVAG